MKPYIKTVCAIIGAISTWGITAYADGAATAIEWFGLLGAIGTALAVYAFPNEQKDD